jgi:DNA mismatch repair protein MutS
MKSSLRLLFTSIVTLLATSPYSLAKTTKTISVYKKTTIDKVSTRYLQSLAAKDLLEQTEFTDYKRRIQQSSKDGKIPVSEVQELFGPIAQLKVAYTIQNNSSYSNDSSYLATIPENTLSDLGLFCGDSDTPENHVFRHIDHTRTIAGRVALQKLIAEPNYSTEKLKARQDFTKLLLHDESLYLAIIKHLNIIKKNEVEFLSIMHSMLDEVEKYYEEVLFERTWLKRFNKNAIVMQAGTHLLAGRELYQKLFTDFFVASFMAAVTHRTQAYNYYYGMNYGYYAFANTILGVIPVPSELRFLSGILGVLNIYLIGDGIYKLYNRLPIIEKLKKKMNAVATVLVTTHQQLVETLAPQKQALAVFPDLIKNDIKSISKINPVLGVLKNLHTSKYKAGNSAVAFTRKEEIKDNFADSYKLLGLIDAHVSIATLMKKHADNKTAHYSFVEYLEGKKPSIDFKGFWHPILDPKTVVINNVTLGTSTIPNNAFITGPNAGGKTTALRSIGLAVLMSQTIGVVPAEKAHMTPFSNIVTYLNIADSEGKESLFQAEMRRARTLLDTVKNLSQDKLNFVIIDELFTGTNPKEGTAAAYGVAKKLSSYENSIAMITTHFIELTSMAKETKRFVNFKVSVREVSGGKFEFPYKLEDGIADQNIALQLLGQDGFDDEIVKEAQDYLKRK